MSEESLKEFLQDYLEESLELLQNIQNNFCSARRIHFALGWSEKDHIGFALYGDREVAMYVSNSVIAERYHQLIQCIVNS